MLLTGLHALAATRGDGVDPRLLPLLQHEDRIDAAGAKVARLDDHRRDARRVAGKN